MILRSSRAAALCNTDPIWKQSPLSQGREALINLTLPAHVTTQPRNAPGENASSCLETRKRPEAEHHGLVGKVAAGRDYPAVLVVGPLFLSSTLVPPSSI